MSAGVVHARFCRNSGVHEHAQDMSRRRFAHLVDPFSGEGIYYAVLSATIAARGGRRNS